MFLIALAFYLISLTFVSIYKYIIKIKKINKNKEPVIFMDMPDPDNHMLAISLAKKLKSINSDKINHLHIVVVGHPVNFELSRFDPKSFEFNQKDKFYEESKIKMDFRKYVKEQKYEKIYWSKEDSKKLLLANVHTLEQLLLDSGVNMNQVSIYDGGITPNSGLSHAIHDYEEFFMNSNGKITSKEEYDEIVNKIHNSKPTERRSFREKWCDSKINNTKIKVKNMIQFCESNQTKDSIKWYLAGPATPLLNLVKINSEFLFKPGFIKAMAGAWEGKANLLGGNFNEQVDWHAFKTLFCGHIGPLFEKANITFLTTETAKQDDWLCFDQEEINDILGDGNSDKLKIGFLAKLWAELKPGDKFQPAFDLALSFDYFNIPFKLHTVNITSIKDTNAFRGERSKFEHFGWRDYIFSFLVGKNYVEAYGY